MQKQQEASSKSIEILRVPGTLPFRFSKVSAYILDSRFLDGSRILGAGSWVLQCRQMQDLPVGFGFRGRA